MLRTLWFACNLPRQEADALNRESGRIYSDMVVWHYRDYRHTGVWLLSNNGERLEDRMGGPTSLHTHSRNAAQQGFYKACKTSKACRKLGLDIKYPHKRKWFRTTIWQPKGIRLKQGMLLLSRAKGLTPITVTLPSNLHCLLRSAFVEVRLVWNKSARHYDWHVVVEDGLSPEAAPGTGVAAVDLGEIHPAALTDGQETLIISCRALRSNQQYTSKRQAEIKSKQARKKRGSRRWKRLQRRKNRFLAKQRRKARDLEHKVSRAVVNWAKARKVGTLVVGDVRDIAKGKSLNTKSQQKIGVWSHGRQRAYLTYKAEAAGMVVMLEDEHNTTKTCPGRKADGQPCGHQLKPKGRIYRCPACGLVAHRDAVGASNLLSRHLYGDVGQVVPPLQTKYRYPFLTGKRSRLDTAELAWGPTTQGA